MTKVKKEIKANGKMPKWSIILVIVLSVMMVMPMVVIGGLMYFSVTEYDYLEDMKKELVLDKDIVAGYDKEKQAYVITGKVTNTGDVVYEAVTVYYNVYDNENNIIGEVSDYIESLSPGETWKFSIVYDEKDAMDIYTYSFDRIDGVENGVW